MVGGFLLVGEAICLWVRSGGAAQRSSVRWADKQRLPLILSASDESLNAGSHLPLFPLTAPFPLINAARRHFSSSFLTLYTHTYEGRGGNSVKRKNLLLLIETKISCFFSLQKEKKQLYQSTHTQRMKRDVWCSIVYRWQVQKKAERGVSEKKKKKKKPSESRHLFGFSYTQRSSPLFKKLVCVFVQFFVPPTFFSPSIKVAQSFSLPSKRLTSAPADNNTTKKYCALPCHIVPHSSGENSKF